MKNLLRLLLLCLLAAMMIFFAACQKRLTEDVVINKLTTIGPTGGAVALPHALKASYEWQELSVEIQNSYRFNGKDATVEFNPGVKVKPFFEARDQDGRTYSFPLTGLLGGKELIFETGKVPVGTSLVSLQFQTSGASIEIQKLVWRSYMREDVKR